jgi:hypothetical protein
MRLLGRYTGLLFVITVNASCGFVLGASLATSGPTRVRLVGGQGLSRVRSTGDDG